MGRWSVESAGVYGLTDSGYGVIGESNTGIGLYAARSGRIRQEGLLAPGMPGHIPNPFEQVRDANGVLWIHNGLGVWRRVNSVRVDDANGSGTPFKPFRRLDTRGGTIKGAGSTTVVSVAGQGSGSFSNPGRRDCSRRQPDCGQLHRGRLSRNHASRNHGWARRLAVQRCPRPFVSELHSRTTGDCQRIRLRVERRCAPGVCRRACESFHSRHHRVHPIATAFRRSTSPDCSP